MMYSCMESGEKKEEEINNCELFCTGVIAFAGVTIVALSPFQKGVKVMFGIVANML